MFPGILVPHLSNLTYERGGFPKAHQEVRGKATLKNGGGGARLLPSSREQSIPPGEWTSDFSTGEDSRAHCESEHLTVTFSRDPDREVNPRNGAEYPENPLNFSG